MIPSEISTATLLKIKNAISLYSLALDIQDFDILKLVFSEDIIADYSAVSPQNSSIRGLNSLIERLKVILDGKVTQHALSTQILEFDVLDEDKYECRAITYFTANTFVAKNQDGVKLDHVSVFGRYHDTLVEDEKGQWRIIQRVVKTFHPRIRNTSTVV